MVESLGGDMRLEEKEDPFVTNAQKSNQEAADQSISVENSETMNNQQTQSDAATNCVE